ncbi:hypothetical protein MTO96_049548 [Rhipicephalus appendiculatus]
MSNRSPDPFYALRGHAGPITAVEFFDDVLFSGSSDGEIFAWDLETFRRKHTLVGHNNKGILWIGHSENALLTQGRDGTVAIWTLSDAQWKQTGTMVTNAKGFCQCSLPGTCVYSYCHAVRARLEDYTVGLGKPEGRRIHCRDKGAARHGNEY